MDLVRPLARAEIPCALVGRKNLGERFSRRVRYFIERANPLSEGELLLERLVAFAKAQAEPPVLYYEGDGGLLFVSRRREDLSGHFRFVVPDRDLVETLLDKARFYEVAKELGFPIAPYSWHQRGSDALELPELAFPFVARPVARKGERIAGFGKAKAVLVRSETEWREKSATFQALGVDLIFQELISGPESAIESYQAYVSGDGRLICDFTGRILRTIPREFGHSTAIVTTASKDTLALGRSILEKLDLRGVAEIEFKRDEDGKLFLLEVNPRFNLWHDVGAVSGVNIPAIVYADLTGSPRPRFGTARSNVRWCRPFADFRAARRDGEAVSSWIRTYLKTEAPTVDMHDWTFLLARLGVMARQAVMRS